jgi:hypothetical protein
MVVSNIIMEDVLRPFFVTLNAFSMSKHAPPGRPPVGKLRDLHVSNIRAIVPKNPTGKGYEQPCVAFVGLPGHPIEGMTFVNFNLLMPGGGTPAQAARMGIPELLDDQKQYPEATHFDGELPASGIYLRHVRNVKLSETSIATSIPDARAFLAGDDLEDVILSDVSGIGFDAAPGLVKFAGAKGVSLQNCRVRIAGQPAPAAIELGGLRTDRPLVVKLTAEEEVALARVRRK